MDQAVGRELARVLAVCVRGELVVDVDEGALVQLLEGCRAERVGIGGGHGGHQAGQACGIAAAGRALPHAWVTMRIGFGLCELRDDGAEGERAIVGAGVLRADAIPRCCGLQPVLYMRCLSPCAQPFSLAVMTSDRSWRSGVPICLSELSNYYLDFDLLDSGGCFRS